MNGPRSHKVLQITLTTVLWLATVVLGLVAVIALIRGVDAQVLTYIFTQMQREEMGIRTANSFSSTINLVTILVTGAVWIGGVIGFGMSYHFKRIGARSSHRVFAWTLGIEVVLIALGVFLQSA